MFKILNAIRSNLHLFPFESPPYALLAKDGMTIRVCTDHTSFVKIGEHWLPNKSRHPFIAFVLWMFANPWSIILSITGVMVFTNYLLFTVDIEGFEMFGTVLRWMGVIMNCGLLLIVSGFACVFCWFLFIHFLKRGEAVVGESIKLLSEKTKTNTTPAISLENWRPIDISPDVLIYSKPGETPEEVYERTKTAVAESNDASWTVVILKGERGGMIYMGNDNFIGFTREVAPWEVGKDVLENDKIVQHDKPFWMETDAEYIDYVDRFLLMFRDWAPVKRMQYDEDAAGHIFMERLKAKTKHGAFVATLIAFLMVPFLMFGQTKSEALRSYLGDTANELVEIGDVTFAFDKGRYPRKSDGSKTWVELLKGVDLYSDRTAGHMVSIKHSKLGIIKKTVSDLPKTVQSSKPIAITMNPADSLSKMLPDSSRAVKLRDDGMDIVDDIVNEVKIGFKPIWALLMYAFGFLLWPIVLGMIIARHIAKTASNETIVDMYGVPILGPFIFRCHQGSAATLLVLTWFLNVGFIMDGFFFCAYHDYPLWLVAIFAFFFVLPLVDWFTSWIVPNVKVAMRGGGWNEDGGHQIKRLH